MSVSRAVSKGASIPKLGSDLLGGKVGIQR